MVGHRLPLSDRQYSHRLPPWDKNYLIYERCIDCSGRPPALVTKHRDAVPGFDLGLSPNYRVGRFTLLGQITVRIHPNIDRIDTVTTDELIDPGSPNARTGWRLGYK